MGRNLITKLAELPTEFVLEKYRPPADLRFSYWYWVSMFEARGLRAHMARTAMEHYGDELRRGALYLLSDPQWPAAKWPTKGGTGLRKYVNASHVRDRTAFDVFAAAEEPKDPRLASYASAWRGLKKSRNGKKGDDATAQFRSLLYSPLWRVNRDSGISVDGDVEVQVNLCGSEDKIIDDFRAWLRRTQVELGVELPKKRVTESDFESWTRFQVMAYLDLTHWARVNSLEIAQNCLGLALFPSEYDVGLSERIRKVVGPMARTVSSENHTDMLRAQALEAEPNPENSVPDKWGTVFMAVEGKLVFKPDSPSQI